MRDLARYLSEMGRIRESGEASSETSFYPALSQLLNQIGARLDPSVHCVITPKNRGGGIPDGGLFLKRSLHPDESEDPLAIRVPERGVIEVKALSASLDRLAQSAQVIRYLQRYGQVLLTNYREFLLVRLGPTGEVVKAEALSIAASESAFWDLTESAIADLEEEVSEFLGRALLADAPLSSPQDLAGFLAAYARIARTRIEKVGMTRELETLKTALEDALGLRFEGQSGDEFFRSDSLLRRLRLLGQLEQRQSNRPRLQVLMANRRVDLQGADGQGLVRSACYAKQSSRWP
jgi:hypothetical protein